MSTFNSRSSTNIYLVGQMKEDITDIKLPTNRDILQYLIYKQSKPKETSKKKPALKCVICCPFKSGTNQANCERDCDEECPCVVRAVKKSWGKAGFLTVADLQIR